MQQPAAILGNTRVFGAMTTIIYNLPVLTSLGALFVSLSIVILLLYND